jgi:hypothetical protein
MAVKQGKAKEVLNKSFIENNEDVTEDRAAELIVRSEQKIRELRDEQANDDKLNAARQIVKDLNAGYTSAIKYEQAKINWLIDKINEIQDGSVNPSSGANA